jgi:hypothetical protein
VFIDPFAIAENVRRSGRGVVEEISHILPCKARFCCVGGKAKCHAGGPWARHAFLLRWGKRGWARYAINIKGCVLGIGFEQMQ